MENIYGWFPKDDDTLEFEFINGINFEITLDFLEESDIKQDVREIQELCDNFYDKYINNK